MPYRIGQTYNPLHTSWPETVQYNYRGGGHELVMFLSAPSEDEILAVRQAPARFGLFVDGDLLLFLYKFGSGIDGDAPYSIHLVPDAERTVPERPAENERALLSVTLVDAATGIIRALRVVSLSHEFTRRLTDEIRQQSRRPFVQAEYDAHLARVYQLWSARELWYKAVAKTAGGD